MGLLVKCEACDAKARSLMGSAGPDSLDGLTCAGQRPWLGPSASQVCDRSHFEHFRAYHGAFYKHVEPTSVTPYSIPVIERALHAVLVIAARHLEGIDESDQIDPDAKGIAELLRFFKERSRRIDADHAALVEKKLEYLIRQWDTIRPGEWGRFGPAPEARPLMYPAGSEPRAEWSDLAWPTPSSMRSVDVECEARVLGTYELG